ncbi:hypothetical protein P4O66_001401 [Electrophorus voltai]|uniref:Homeobox domain-containing protein n=1 Tax=Electrophorus voltai TaxID=2609070 RepID=A0AAD9DVH5_9TELE|nr:hypothetical protein P4O66_001401 [Electrophorus voltai]
MHSSFRIRHDRSVIASKLACNADIYTEHYGSGRIFAIIVALRSSLAGKSKHVGDKAVRTVAPQCTVRGGQVQKGTQRNSSIAAGDFGAVARHGLCPQGRSSLTGSWFVQERSQMLTLSEILPWVENKRQRSNQPSPTVPRQGCTVAVPDKVMASRRKSTTPCMIRPNDLVEQDDMDVCLDSTLENGASHVPASENWTDKKNLNLNEFKEHVDSNHPNVILNPLYLCAVCNFNTKKFDTLTEHNEKCHPGESNFKFKRIKLNSQTILEQTIEGSNCAVIYDATSPQTGEDLSTFPLSKPIAVKIVASQAAQAVKRPLTASVVAPEVKRPSIIQTVQTTSKSASPTPSLASDCKKTPDQIKELMASYTQCQFPDDEEVYRLIEMTGLSWGEIKKWFSDQRHGNHKAVQSLKADLPLKESQPQKPVATQFPLLERVKGKSSEQMKMLEECFQKTSFPTQAEIECLAADTRLSKTEIEGWFTERRALRDNLEQALLNSMGSKRLDRVALNGVHEQEARARTSPLPLLTSSVGPEIDSKSLGLLKEVFSQTQWPSPEEYNQLELETGLARTELVRWFKDNRSALKNGTLEWMEQFQNMSNKKHNGKNSSLTTEPAQSVLQRHFQEANVLKGEDVEKLAERSKLTNQDIVNWFTSKLGHTMPDISKGKDQHEQGSADNGRWVKVPRARTPSVIPESKALTPVVTSSACPPPSSSTSTCLFLRHGSSAGWDSEPRHPTSPTGEPPVPEDQESSNEPSTTGNPDGSKNRNRAGLKVVVFCDKARKMSLNSIQPTVSTLKTCQTDIGTGMDIVSEVALDLVEAQDTDDSPNLKRLEQMMLECARLDKEISCFVASTEQMTAQVRHEPPQAMFTLKDSVKNRFKELMAEVSDADVRRHSKVVAFKESIRKSLIKQTDEG